MNKIIAIVGMCGAGKSVAVDFLVKKGFQKVYFGGLILEEMQKQNLEVTPENEKKTRERLRKEYGMGVVATLALPKIKEFVKDTDVVLDGLYSWDELTILEEEFPTMDIICIIADKNLRYERLANREIRPFTKEEAKSRDISEIENLAKGGPISYADYYILNNDSLNTFEKRLSEILEKLIKIK